MMTDDRLSRLSALVEELRADGFSRVDAATFTLRLGPAPKKRSVSAEVRDEAPPDPRFEGMPPQRELAPGMCRCGCPQIDGHHSVSGLCIEGHPAGVCLGEERSE